MSAFRTVLASCAAAAVLASACSAPAEPAAAPAASPSPANRAGKTVDTSLPPDDRYISVRRAVATLGRHVDSPVVLPRDELAGLRSYRWWSADSKYLDWEVRDGRRTGTLQLERRDEVLQIWYGYASPDGCGGRETAVRTDVLGKPALLWTYDDTSLIVWPVRPHGRVGRYGLSGTFGPFQIVRLAESMQTQLDEPPRDPGC